MLCERLQHRTEACDDTTLRWLNHAKTFSLKNAWRGTKALQIHSWSQQHGVHTCVLSGSVLCMADGCLLVCGKMRCFPRHQICTATELDSTELVNRTTLPFLLLALFALNHFHSCLHFAFNCCNSGDISSTSSSRMMAPCSLAFKSTKQQQQRNIFCLMRAIMLFYILKIVLWIES